MELVLARLGPDPRERIQGRNVDKGQQRNKIYLQKKGMCPLRRDLKRKGAASYKVKSCLFTKSGEMGWCLVQDLVFKEARVSGGFGFSHTLALFLWES